MSGEKAARYVKRVLAGEERAGEVTKEACRRHVADLEAGRWVWSIEHADRVCRFVESLPVVKGKHADKGLVLLDWQCFYFASIFGWRDPEDGTRRFKHAYLSIARKNGKTMLGTAACMYVFCVEGPKGGEIYNLAGHKDQAAISWYLARDMVAEDEEFAESYGLKIPRGVRAGVLARPEKHIIWKPLPKETHAGSLDGLAASCVFFDEIHGVRNGESLMQAMEYSQAGQADPLFLGATTSGVTVGSYWHGYEKYLRRVVTGAVSEERTFYLGYHLDEHDDLVNPRVWAKANPSLGLIQDEATLQRQYNRAVEMPKEMLLWKVKQLNAWPSGASSWFDEKAFEEAKIPRTPTGEVFDKYADHLCWAAVVPVYDAGVSALAWLFKDENTEDYVLRMEYWVMRGMLDHRLTKCLMLPDVSADELVVRKRAVMPFSVIRDRLLEGGARLRLICAGYERNAEDASVETEMALVHDRGFKIAGVLNTHNTMTGLIRRVAGLIEEGRLKVERSDILDRQLSITALDTKARKSTNEDTHRLISVDGTSPAVATTGPRAWCYALAASTARAKVPPPVTTSICY